MKKGHIPCSFSSTYDQLTCTFSSGDVTPEQEEKIKMEIKTRHLPVVIFDIKNISNVSTSFIRLCYYISHDPHTTSLTIKNTDAGVKRSLITAQLHRNTTIL